MAIVSTGQITIVDTNDSKPISAYITSSNGKQQVYEPAGGSYTPDWSSGAGVVFTAKAYAGLTTGVTEVTGSLTNRKFYVNVGTENALTGTAATITGTDLATYFGAGTFTVSHTTSTSTITIDANLLNTTSTFVLFFSGDYTDPATGLSNKVLASIDLGLVKTGTNAVYITFRGGDSIVQSDTSAKNTTAIAADLVRSSGVDTNAALSYKWYYNTGGTMAQISTAVSGYATRYGLSNSASPNLPTSGTLGANIPASGSGTLIASGNTLTIAETAITSLGIFRVDINDGTTTFSNYFTIYDVSDPYSVNIISSAGDKLQNGVGSTNLTPVVYNGSSVVSSLTGWTFTWYLYDRNGKRAGFVDQGATTPGSQYYNTGLGRAITASGYNTTTRVLQHATITNAAPTASMVKIVKANGTVLYYETSATTTTSVTLSNAPTYLSLTDFPLPTTTSELDGAYIYLCTASGGILSSSAGAAVTVNGTDIDVKGKILCDANRP